MRGPCSLLLRLGVHARSFSRLFQGGKKGRGLVSCVTQPSTPRTSLKPLCHPFYPTGCHYGPSFVPTCKTFGIPRAYPLLGGLPSTAESTLGSFTFCEIRISTRNILLYKFQQRHISVYLSSLYRIVRYYLAIFSRSTAHFSRFMFLK